MSHLQYQPLEPLQHKMVVEGKSFVESYPAEGFATAHQSFHYLVSVVREAAIDPNVTSIRMTFMSRCGKIKIVNALQYGSQWQKGDGAF